VYEFRESVPLDFEPVEHVYSVEGRPVPSVTTVLKAGGVYGEYSAVPEHVLKRAGDIGTEVHRVIDEYLALGRALKSDDSSASAYLTGFKAFDDLDLLTTRATECKLWHPELWYAGTVDWVGEINGRPSIIDWKTTNKLNEKAVKLQLAAYEELVAYNLLGERRSFDKYALLLDKKGGFTLHNLNDPLAFGEFMWLLEKLEGRDGG